jgi:hypothetical protein
MQEKVFVYKCCLPANNHVDTPPLHSFSPSLPDTTEDLAQQPEEKLVLPPSLKG